MSDKVNLKEKFQKFDAHWSPKIVAEVNDSQVILFKAKGEFIWHKHEKEDEFFLVIKGELRIKLRDKEVRLKEGEFFIVPKGVEHMPYVLEEAHVLLFEPKGVANTGDSPDQKAQMPDWI